MAKLTRRQGIAIGVATVLALGSGGVLSFIWFMEQSAISTACTWARVAPPPTSARELKVGVSGSLFTRTFELSFEASPSAVAAWMKHSPGIQDAGPPELSGVLARYVIKPGAGAQWAEVRIDGRRNRVTIRTYWS